MAAVGEDEPVQLEAELVRLVAAEHLDRDGEAHVMTDHAGTLDAERAGELTGALALVEERVRSLARLVRGAEAELIEDGDAEAGGEEGESGREVVAARRKPVHQEQVRATTLLQDEEPVALGQAHEAAAPHPCFLNRGHGGRGIERHARYGWSS